MLSRRTRKALYCYACMRAKSPFKVSVLKDTYGAVGLVAYNEVSHDSSILRFQPLLKDTESMKLIGDWLDALHEWWTKSIQMAKRLKER